MIGGLFQVTAMTMSLDRTVSKNRPVCYVGQKRAGRVYAAVVHAKEKLAEQYLGS